VIDEASQIISPLADRGSSPVRKKKGAGSMLFDHAEPVRVVASAARFES